MKPNSLDDNVIYLCSTFSHRFNLLLRHAFAQEQIPITPEQLAIIAFLWYKQEATQQEISRTLNRDETTITRVIINMLKNKIVTQKVNPADKRSRIIALSGKGKRIQERAIQASGKLYTRVLDGVEEEEWRIGVSLLRKLLQNVGNLSSNYTI